MQRLSLLNNVQSPAAPASMQSWFTGTVFKLLELRQELRFRLERQRQRARLLELSDEQLLDIGISRAQAESEGRKGFCEN
ncbi:MAG: DUF1127 domain-containing protein [Gammaproteobacteria bacterium]